MCSIVIAVFCLKGSFSIWQKGVYSDANNIRHYRPQNPDVALYHSQCANPPTLEDTDTLLNPPPCYDEKTNIQISWSDGYWRRFANHPNANRYVPAGFVAVMPAIPDNQLLDLSRKDIRPDSGNGLIEVWQDYTTKIVLDGQTIDTYNNPELDFAKDFRPHHNYAIAWLMAVIAVVCILALVITQAALIHNGTALPAAARTNRNSSLAS